MDEEAGRRREEGGWSRGWKSIPLGGVTSRAQLARARVSFRRGFRILVAVDWRFLRFRFTSTVEAVMHTVREPDLRPPTPPLPSAPFARAPSYGSPVLASLFLPLLPSLSLCSSPRCFSSFFHPPPSNSASAVRRRLSLLPRGERESVLSNFLADISRYNNWAFSANLPFFSPASSRLGLAFHRRRIVELYSPGNGRGVECKRATNEGQPGTGHQWKHFPSVECVG